MSAVRKITTWIGTTVVSPLILAPLGLPVVGAALGIVIILAILYCWTVRSKDHSDHLAMILSARQPSGGEGTPKAAAPFPGAQPEIPQPDQYAGEVILPTGPAPGKPGRCRPEDYLGAHGDFSHDQPQRPATTRTMLRGN